MVAASSLGDTVPASPMRFVTSERGDDRSFANERIPSASFSVAMASSFIIQRNSFLSTEIRSTFEVLSGDSLRSDLPVAQSRSRSRSGEIVNRSQPARVRPTTLVPQLHCPNDLRALVGMLPVP